MLVAIGSRAWPSRGDDAWVIFDSSRGNEFNIYATKISADLTVGETKPLIATDRYEGRVSAIGAKDGKGIWLACERGNQQWGLDMRAHGHPQGLNGRKDTVVAYLDLASGKVDELPSPDALFADLPGPQPAKAAAPRGNNPKAKAKAEAQAKAAQPKKKGNQPPPECRRRREPAASHARCCGPSLAHRALLQSLLLAHRAHPLRCRDEAVDEALCHPRQRVFAGSPDESRTRQRWQPVDRLAERFAQLEAALKPAASTSPKSPPIWTCHLSP
jgi:hypothetical protein